jgi:hypothetical protein
MILVKEKFFEEKGEQVREIFEKITKKLNEEGI